MEWISRPRSTLFVNAGETAKIDWKFPSGSRLITYKKKSTILGSGITIAFKKDSATPDILSGTKSIIRVEDSGALSILKAGLKDEGFYEIDIVYDMGITLKDEVQIKIQGKTLLNHNVCLNNEISQEKSSCLTVRKIC